MSCKGAATAYEAKQITRIFRSRRASCLTRNWTHGEIGQTLGTSESTSYCLLRVSADENKRETKEDKKGNEKGLKTTSRTWFTDNHVNEDNLTTTRTAETTAAEKNAELERVSDIEKWFKPRAELTMNIDLDTMKSEGEVGVDRYLADELPHSFLGKDPDALSIDIDLSDKKLNLTYDPILQDLQNEKLLETCEKDEFMLPEFQLDHLEPLTLSPEDMMVAGEILPTTSSHSCLNDVNQESIKIVEQIVQSSPVQILQESVKQVQNIPESSQSSINKNPAVDSETNINSTEETPDFFGKAPITENAVEDSQTGEDESHRQSISHKYVTSEIKGELLPKLTKKEEKLVGKSGKRPVEWCANDIMAVVAISTDKVSNMTQIVINTGTEEQIYRGKTSELIQATGNFPKLPKIEASSMWNDKIEYNVDITPNSQHETIISNALEELGITDDSLQPTSITEHGKVWLCPRDDCNRQFSRLYALKGHLLAHYGVRPFKCDFEGCAWAFYSEFKLKRHKETHLKRKDYICNVEGCNRRFTTVYNLWSHEKLHSRPNRIVCQVPGCQEKFQTKRALELHMKSHDQSHAPYVCKHEGCDKRYYSSNALTSHQRCHSYKEIDVKCSWPGCGKVFDKPCRLKAHVRSHTGCKPYLCTFQGCQWAFSSSSKLKRHQKKHTNERKFVCDVPSCRKAFMRSEHLKEHRLTHEEGRYFQCYTCDAKFSAKSSLYVHVKKHQTKDDVHVYSHGSANNCNAVKTKDTHCSKVNSINKGKKKSLKVNGEIAVLKNDAEPDNCNSCNYEEDLCMDHTVTQDEADKITLLNDKCPVEISTTSYETKDCLKEYTQKTCGMSIEHLDVANNVEPNGDYILYAPAGAESQPVPEQMIMVTPCDAVIFSTSPELDCCLPEPEPPPLASISKCSQSPKPQTVKEQGSARTGLTFSDVWRLKANGALLDSVVGASDSVLGTADFSNLLLTEELPSTYYQDDVVGTEYQVLLLDSGTAENTMNLRSLE